MRGTGGAALSFRDFRLFWVSMLATGLALQMAMVAIGWQVYSIHGNPLDLGLVGLAEFLPLPLLSSSRRPLRRRPAPGRRPRLSHHRRRHGGDRPARGGRAFTRVFPQPARVDRLDEPRPA